MKQIYTFLLTKLAQLYLWRYKPLIIGITGNVGKTSTKEAIASVLRPYRTIRSASGNLNNHLGLPLAILGDWPEFYERGPSLFFWLKVIVKSKLNFLANKPYPSTLILEYGADKPGDIAYLVKIVKPDIAVVTSIGEIPVHVEKFKNIQELILEKSKLVSNLTSRDYAVLNHDDEKVWAMASQTKGRVSSFGQAKESSIHFDNLDFLFDQTGRPQGVIFKIFHGPHSYVPVIIDGSLGYSQAYAASAAACVGLILGLNIVQISQGLKEYRGPAGRLRILGGVKNSTIIDDTYNASPASMRLALETLINLPAKRRVAVLGDMLELGEHTITAHQKIGDFIGGKVEELICVGERAKFIADSAGNQMDAHHIHLFSTSLEAKTFVEKIIQSGDLVLIKGSQGMRMERIVEEVMAEPEKKKELLVRQSDSWLNKK